MTDRADSSIPPHALDCDQFRIAFPLRFFFNSGRDHASRLRMQEVSAEHNFTLTRVPIPWMPDAALRQERVRAVAIRLALRRARLWQAPAVLLVRDDVEPHPDLEAVFAQCRLPEGWRVIVLGGRHERRPAAFDRGVLRVSELADLHAVGIRRPAYREVEQLLRTASTTSDGPRIGPERGDKSGGHLGPLLPLLNQVATTGNVLCVHPALFELRRSASKGSHSSDAVETSDGLLSSRSVLRPGSESQRDDPGGSVHRGLDGEALGVASWLDRGDPVPFGPGRKIAYLFLTRADPHHTGVWGEYWNGQEGRYSIYTHAKHPEAMGFGPWRDALVDTLHETEWGKISLVWATLSLIRAALEDKANAFFVLCSESCVPIKPFSALAHLLSFDPRGMIGQLSLEEMKSINPWTDERVRLAPGVPRASWRFHSQWFVLNRDMAEALMGFDLTAAFSRSFAPDEAYFSTVLEMIGYPLSQRASPLEPTYVKWNPEVRGHPETFEQVTPELAAELARSPHFFARKFSSQSNIGTFGLHLARGRSL